MNVGGPAGRIGQARLESCQEGLGSATRVSRLAACGTTPPAGPRRKAIQVTRLAFLTMGTFRWTPERMEQLEHAVQNRRRVTLRRRGNEYVVVAAGLKQSRGREALAGYLAMTGEEMLFVLADLDHFQVLDS